VLLRLLKCIAGYSQIAFVTLWINIQRFRSLSRMRVQVRILTVLIFALMVVSTLQVASLITGSANVGVAQATTVAPSGAYFDHVVIILMENQGVYDICLSSPPPCSTSGPAPYMAGLANAYGIGARYLSLINTSQPNYIALISGSTQGCTSSGCPTITAPNLVDRFEAVGLSWKAYFENQNVAAGCDSSSHEPYEPIHNPFISFQDITSNAARCNQLVLANPSTCGSVTDCVLINDLNSASAPNFMWLTPNDCNNMRGASGICSSSITLGDNYLKSLVPQILNSNTFKTGRSALFITFDEGNGYCPLNGSSESCVYSVWAGPAAKTAFGTNNLYNHYSFPKTVEVNWNLATLSTGDGSATPMTEFFKPISASPDFSISANPASLSITSGSSSTSTITLTSLNSFAGTVTLSSTGSPAGLSLSLNPSSVSLSSGGTGSSTLTVSTQSSTPAGIYTVTVTGSSGTLSHSATIQVSVKNAQDFSITENPASITIQRGASSSSTITATSLNGFSGTVTLTDSISPATSNPPVISLSSSSLTLSSGGSASSTLSITTSSSTTSGSYTISVTGTSGSLSHSVTIGLTVSQTADYSLTSSPSTVNILAGSSGTSTLTAASLGGFSGTVSLSVSTGAGLTATVNPTSIVVGSGGTGTSTLTVSSSTIGSYTVTVTGTSGSLAHSVSVTVVVSDFSISISPSSLSLPRGSSGTSLITLTSLNGFSGTVTLSTVVSPASGPRVFLSSPSITLTPGGQSTSTLTVRAQHKTPIGSYTITVTGTSGSVSHSVTMTVDITA